MLINVGWMFGWLMMIWYKYLVVNEFMFIYLRWLKVLIIVLFKFLYYGINICYNVRYIYCYDMYVCIYKVELKEDEILWRKILKIEFLFNMFIFI